MQEFISISANARFTDDFWIYIRNVKRELQFPKIYRGQSVKILKDGGLYLRIYKVQPMNIKKFFKDLYNFISQLRKNLRR